MINIQIIRNADRQLVECLIDGHAGYDNHGYDIVCAAISALSCTAILGLQQVAHQTGEFHNESGRCVIKLSGAITDSGQNILETMILGFVEIQRLYSDYITLSEM